MNTGQLTRLEQKAYAALEKVEKRAALFAKSQTIRRLGQHLATWEKLVAQARSR